MTSHKNENIKYPHILIELLNQINEKLENHIPKTWLSTNETSEYLGYSKESIHKMIKNGQFIQGIHYHKKIKKIIFNKSEIDNWVISDISSNTTNFNVDETLKELLPSS